MILQAQRNLLGVVHTLKQVVCVKGWLKLTCGEQRRRRSVRPFTIQT